MQGLARPVEACVLGERGAEILRDAREIGALEEEQLVAQRRGRVRGAGGERVDVPADRLQPDHERRQREVLDVHQVVGVEIRIEDQVRRVADVREERVHVRGELPARVVRGRAGRGPLERAALRGKARERRVRAAAPLQLRGGRVQGLAERGVDLGELGEGPIQLGVARLARALRERDQRVEERPLVPGAAQLLSAERDVLLDAAEHHVHEGRGHRETERERDAREAQADSQTAQHEYPDPGAGLVSSAGPGCRLSRLPAGVADRRA